MVLILMRLSLRFGRSEFVSLKLGGLESADLEYGVPVFVNRSGCLMKGFVVGPNILLTRDATRFQNDEVKVPKFQTANLNPSKSYPTVQPEHVKMVS